MKIVVTRKMFWYYRLLAANGQVLATSETYYSKYSARRAARKLAFALNIPIEIK